MYTIGSLCTGYGGLDMAVERVLGGEVVWYSELDKHPSTLLSERYPGVQNIGDLTSVDWSALPPIDVLTGGYPCQPFSVAGNQLGERDPRHLWPYIREAIRVLRPRLAFFENVSNHRKLGFGTVLRDCAEDGLHVRWTTVRASDVGAPHKRERLFFAVTPDTEDYRQPRGGRHGDGGMDLRTAVATITHPERFGLIGRGAAPAQTERTLTSTV